MSELDKAYETVDMLKALDLPISKDQLENIERLEKENGDVTKYYRYFPQLSKPIIDEIDKVIAKHYGFTEEEIKIIEGEE